MLYIFLLALCGILAYFLYDFWMRSQATEKTAFAKVLSKTMDNKKNDSLYYIGFILSDGTRKNVKATVSPYNTLVDGEEGVLTYKEYNNHAWFVGFQPKTSN